MTGGREWIVDASGCDPTRLRDRGQVDALLERIVVGLELHVVHRAHHQFAEPAGITSMYLLSESHLTIHTFPEAGLATLNIYCCRARVPLAWPALLAEALGATSTTVRELVRGEAAA